MISVSPKHAAPVALALLSGACSSSNTDPTIPNNAGGASGGTFASLGLVPGGGGLVSSGGSVVMGGMGQTRGHSAPSDTTSGGTNALGGASSARRSTASGGNTASGTRVGATSKVAAASGAAGSGGGSVRADRPTTLGGRTGSDGISSTGGTTTKGDTGLGGNWTSGGSTASGEDGAAVPSPGCGKISTVTFGAVPGESGTAVGTGAGGYVRIGARGFAMRLPDNYDNKKPYPLIFGFHWNGGNSKEVDTGGSNGYTMAHFGLQKLSNNGAIFVAPDGLNAGWANSGGQDLKFVDDMVKLVEDNYCVDTARIFANGFSYGGGMSYAIACGRAKVFRGVAIYDGAELSGCEGGNDPIAYWQMAGLADNVCTIGMAAPMRDRFVKNNHCTAQNPPQPSPAPPYLNPGGHVCTTYSGCSSGHPLRWCVHQSGHGNAIVDGTGDLYNSCATPPKSCSSTCPCSWVPEDVWTFFRSL